MYDFILNMWIMKRIDEVKIQSYIIKNYITEEESNVILSTPQMIN